ncbi:MAG TPA: hypothetical protein PKA63_07760 [Oligoflexia bacterium]|nr:hypothetical protein [Oligoflexia bacterium]HMP48545.1 hypothetical protein [Oligoflexia bacterium]
MNTKLLYLVSIAIALYSGVVFGQSDEIVRYIKDLDSDKFSIRQQATRKSIEIGTPVIDKIVFAQESSSLEVKTRAQLIEKEILIPILLEPSLVHFEGYATVTELLSEISRQTGNQIDFDESVNNTICFWSIEKKTFWEAIVQVCKQSENTIATENNMNGWKIVPGEFQGDYVATNEIALGFLYSINEMPDVRKGRILAQMNMFRVVKIPPEQGLGFYFHVFLEPRLSIASVLNQAELLECKADIGTKIGPASDGNPQFVDVINGNSRIVGIFCGLYMPNRSPLILTRLSCCFRFLLLGNTTEIIFSEVSQKNRLYHDWIELVKVDSTEDFFIYTFRASTKRLMHFEVVAKLDEIYRTDYSVSSGINIYSVVLARDGRLEFPPIKLRAHNFIQSVIVELNFKNMPIPAW